MTDIKRKLKEAKRLEDAINSFVKAGSTVKVTCADPPNSIGFLIISDTDESLADHVTFEV